VNSTGETELYEADAVVFAVGVQAMQVIKFVGNMVWFIDNIPTFLGFLFFNFAASYSSSSATVILSQISCKYI
jgi:hypothetical protein